MEFKVLKKQNNSRMCFVCGIDNDAGLKGVFYECEGGVLIGIYDGLDVHQSYPGRMHGGISGAILDESIGRAKHIEDSNIWGVTTKFEVRYKKPVPLGEKLYSISRTTEGKRLFDGEGALYDKDGNVLVTAKATYLVLPAEKIAGANIHEYWFMVEDEVPEKIVIPNISLDV